MKKTNKKLNKNSFKQNYLMKVSASSPDLTRNKNNCVFLKRRVLVGECQFTVTREFWNSMQEIDCLTTSNTCCMLLESIMHSYCSRYYKVTIVFAGFATYGDCQ